MRLLQVVMLVPVLFACLQAWAGGVAVRATLDADRVAMGSSVQLSVTVEGTQDVEVPALPPMEGLEPRYIGPSTQVQVVNGEYSTAKTFVWMLIPLHEGTARIPEIPLTIDGTAYRTGPLAVEVVSASAAGVTRGGSPLEDPNALATRVRMEVGTVRTAPFVDEEIPVVVRLFVRDLPLRNISYPQVVQEGFVLSEPDRPRQYQETMGGVVYDVVEFSFRLTPLRAGELKLGPVTISGDLLVKNSDGRSGLFQDDFFAGFFNSFARKPITVTSPPVTLQVRPLPVEGKPADFSGGVGQFSFDMSASPAQVKEGDPVTLRMTIGGKGALKNVRFPTFRSERFKVYDPQLKDQNGSRVLEQVVIPTDATVNEVPAVVFSWFDPVAGKYESVTRGPFPLEVSPLVRGEEFQAVAFQERPVTLLKENVGRDIVFIKEDPGLLRPKSGLRARLRLPLLLFALFVALWVPLLIFVRHRRRLADDPLLAARYGAGRRALVAVQALKIPGETGGASRSFYAALIGIIGEYLEKKAGIPSGASLTGDIMPVLLERGVPAAVQERLRGVYELADQARFAGLGIDASVMARSRAEVLAVLHDLEKIL